MRDINLTTPEGQSTPLADGDQVRVAAILPMLDNSVVLSGFVYRPGSFQYTKGLRLSGVLTSFDELKPNADPHYVMIRRVIPPTDRVEVVSADLTRALAAPGTAADPELKPRDQIEVFDLSASRGLLIAPIIKAIELQASPDTSCANRQHRRTGQGAGTLRARARHARQRFDPRRRQPRRCGLRRRGRTDPLPSRGRQGAPEPR